MRYQHLAIAAIATMTVLLQGREVLAQDPNSGDNSMTYNKSAMPSGNISTVPSSKPTLNTDLYTGRLQVSIPLFTLDGSDLKVPISLEYTAGDGVRPSDPNTPTGMDWTLVAGGSITRMVRGLPDESDQGYIGSNNAQNFGGPVNMGFSAVTMYGNLNDDIYEFNNHYSKRVFNIGPEDGEPDVFYINTPLFSAQFVIDEYGHAVFQNNTGLKVVHQLYKNSVNAGLYGFTVTDDQGNQYIFGSQQSTRELTTTSFFGTPFTFVSTWYLEKIILFNSKETVNFVYWQGNDYTVYNYASSLDYTSNYPSGSGFPPGTTPTFSNFDDVRPAQITTITYNGPKYISQIVTKLGEADFTYTYNANTNINASNPPVLSSLTIRQLDPIQGTNTTSLQTFNFNYTDIETGTTGWTQPYPYPDIYSDYYRRLLNSISVTGNNPTTVNPITLYNLKYWQLLPYPDRGVARSSDFWGYANTTISSLSDYYFTNPDQARQPTFWNPPGSTQEVPSAAIFALQELDDVNGGATTINFESNTYYNGSQNVTVGGTRVANIVHAIPGGASLTTTYNYNDVNGNSTGQIWNDWYRRVTMQFGSACCNLSTLTYSQSPYGLADNNGVFVGYSAVRTTQPNGGYEIDNFTNFSDYPDNVSITPSFFVATSVNTPNNVYVGAQISFFSYKRGLLKSSAMYTSGGNIITQTSNTYGSLDGAPTVKGQGIQDATWPLSGSTYAEMVNFYNINVENWRLTQTVKRDYDQLNPANYVQTTANYTYCPNNRLVHSITTTDSKGQTHIQTFYHADDASIPMVTGSEQTAITAMLNANRTNVLIHQTDSRNGVIHQIHNSFGTVPYGYATNVYLLSNASYVGNTLIDQQFFNYDASNSQMVSTYSSDEKPVSLFYAYNTAYPVVKAENVLNTASFGNQQATQSGTLNIPPGNGGSYVTNFTTTATGTITIAMPPGSYLGQSGGATLFFNFTLSGPAGGSGSLCNNSTTGYTCSVGNSVPFSNMPAGTYTLTVNPSTNTCTTTVGVTYTFPGIQIVATGSTEFYFEGFEQNAFGTTGSSHTGSRYCASDFTVPYTMPNSRQYLIQWWSLAGGKWIFHQQSYYNNMVLAGPVDDVRVFPSDALMTTYTYSPLLGRTSQTDPSGKSTTYEYDGLGRLLRVRDQDGNILKQYDYQYQVGLQQ